MTARPRAWAGPALVSVFRIYLVYLVYIWIYLDIFLIFVLVLQPVISLGGLGSNFGEATNEKLPYVYMLYHVYIYIYIYALICFVM